MSDFGTFVTEYIYYKDCFLGLDAALPAERIRIV